MSETADTITPEIVPPEGNSAQKEPFGRNGGRKKGQTTNKIAAAMGLMLHQGLDAEDAYMIATGKDSAAPNTIRRLKDKVSKWSLRHPSALKAASKTVLALAQGEAVNGIEPKCSTVLAAAQRVVDASDPVIKRTESLQVSVSLDYLPFDLGQYK